MAGRPHVCQSLARLESLQTRDGVKFAYCLIDHISFPSSLAVDRPAAAWHALTLRTLRRVG